MIWLFLSCNSEPMVEKVCNTTPQPIGRRLTATEYQNTIFDLTGVLLPESLLPPTNRTASPRTWAINNTLSNNDLETLLLAGKHITESIDWNEHLSCQISELTIECSKDFLQQIAASAYRRDLLETELEIILAPLSSGIPLENALSISLQIILQSPQVLYLQNPDPLHSISYLLRQRPPSEELRAQLSEANTDSIARTLLEDPMIIHTLTSFHEDWLNLYQLDQLTKPDSQYTEAFKEAFSLENSLFISNVLWNGEATFASLLLNSYAWVNPELQSTYELSGIENWTLVDLGPDRPGILSRSAFLNAHSYSSQTAPVRRGYFVLNQLLCTELIPPADVNMNLEEASTGNTILDQLNAHSSDPSCAGCHDQIDPIGIAFEHYDHLGEWRDSWDGTSIPSSGNILSQDYSSFPAMVEIIANSQEAQACYAQRWLEYALARPLTEEDQCQLEMIQQKFIASGGSLRQLLYSIATSTALLGENNAD